MVIYVPGDLKREVISMTDLPVGWNKSTEDGYEICRKTGDHWALAISSPILFVPSAFIKNEFNILIKMYHPQSRKIRIIDIEPFFIDPRFEK